MQLDSSFTALAATVGRCFGHALDTARDLRVEIDGHRIKVAVEEIRIDPQRDAGILVAEHPRHRKDIRAGTDRQTRARVPQIVGRAALAPHREPRQRRRRDRHYPILLALRLPDLEFLPDLNSVAVQ